MRFHHPLIITQVLVLLSALPGIAAPDGGEGTRDTLGLLAAALPSDGGDNSGAAVPAHALPSTPGGFAHWSTVTGDWGGVRPAFEESGIALTFLYRTDQLSNVSGGLEQHGGAIHNLDLQMSVDGGTLFGLDGVTLFAHVIANNGGSISRWVGDVQMVSNLEAVRVTKLYQLWISTAFGDDRYSVLAGLYDLNTEFYVTEAAGLFLNSSHGVGKELAQTGSNGPGIFPNTALAVRLNGSFDGWYGRGAVMDGRPGTVDDPYAPSFSWSADEGVLVVAEAGLVREGRSGYKYAAGWWWYPPSHEAPFTNTGFYLMAEQEVLSGSVEGQGLRLFGRFGMADAHVNLHRAHVGCGAVYTGLIPGRDDDRLGVAVAAAHQGSHLPAGNGGSTPAGGTETALEISYRFQLLPSIALQPDLQYVIAPGCRGDLPDATVLSVRLHLLL